VKASQKTLFHGMGPVMQFLAPLNEELPTNITGPSFYKYCYLDADLKTPHKIVSLFLSEATVAPVQPFPEFHRTDFLALMIKM
jgi:hypothetical protein